MASWKGIPCLTSLCTFHFLVSLILSSFTFLWRNFKYSYVFWNLPTLSSFLNSYVLPPIFSLHFLLFISRFQKHFPLLFLLSQPEMYLCYLSLLCKIPAHHLLLLVQSLMTSLHAFGHFCCIFSSYLSFTFALVTLFSHAYTFPLSL